MSVLIQEEMSQNSLLRDFREIVLDLKTYFHYQKEIGIEGFLRVPLNIDSAEGDGTFSPKRSVERAICRHNIHALETIKDELRDCKRCKLHSGRKNIVFGTGSESAKLVFVGEAPGRDEDIQGEPFVGKAGQLLTRIISAIRLSRNDVYIANIIKCRPPGNRDPEQDEIAACEPFLIKQIQMINPDIICALGAFAAQTLLRTTQKISDLRGRFHDYQGTKLIPTYHPAYLLRNPYFKRHVWEDMQMIQKEYHY